MALTAEVRFGLIGCGRVAPRHAQALRELPGLRLIAVADQDAGRARQFAATYGAAAWRTDFRDLLARDDVDVVTICTPSGLHASMALEAIRAGKHVLVEKPIALTTADADAMIAAARAADVRLGVVLQNRYNPPLQAAYAAVRGGYLGRLHLGAATVRWYRPQAYYEDDWHGLQAMGGGALINQSIHHIDALLWLFDEPVASLFAYTGTLAHRMEAEDAGVAVLRFASGALATIEGSTVTAPRNLEGSVAVFGPDGAIKIGGTALNRREIWEIAAGAGEPPPDPPDPPSVYGHSHRLVIADMAAAVREGRPPRTDGHAARQSLAVVEMIYESVRTGLPVHAAPPPGGIARPGAVQDAGAPDSSPRPAKVLRSGGARRRTEH